MIRKCFRVREFSYLKTTKTTPTNHQKCVTIGMNSSWGFQVFFRCKNHVHPRIASWKSKIPPLISRVQRPLCRIFTGNGGSNKKVGKKEVLKLFTSNFSKFFYFELSFTTVFFASREIDFCAKSWSKACIFVQPHVLVFWAYKRKRQKTCLINVHWQLSAQCGRKLHLKNLHCQVQF